MINASYQRASILQQQGRHADAEGELRKGLTENPDDPLLHAMLALSLSEQQKFVPATEEAGRAIGLAPDLAFSHYAMAKVMFDRQRFDEAAVAVDEAIGLDIYNPDAFALLSAIRLQQRKWPSALEAADKALELEAQHESATNLRAMALVQLGRRDEAAGTLGDALSRNPLDPTAHANEGWRLLHHGEPRKAMEHFRESLRLDPTSEWARAGIIEALKAQNMIYRGMLAYFLWMNRLSSGARWGIIVGGYIGYRALGSISRSNPDLSPILTPVLIAYAVFALMTWLSSPLFNLLLRLNKFGRLALSREQRRTSDLIGASLVVCVVCVGLSIVSRDARWLRAGIVFGLLIAPLSMVFLPEQGWPRYLMMIAALALVVLGGLSVATAFMASDPFNASDPMRRAGAGLFTLFLYGILISQFGGMWLCSVRVRR